MAKYAPGDYEFLMRASAGEGQIILNVDFTYKLKLVDPCPTVELIDLDEVLFADMSYKLGQNEVTQSFPIAELVKLNTLVDCGFRSISLVQVNGDLLDAKIFSVVESELETTLVVEQLDELDESTLGTHMIQAVVLLAEYPDVYLTLGQPFEV